LESILLILEFVLAAFITIAVMLQKSSSIGLGAYSGSNESVFGAKGPAAFLAKITMFLAIAFVVNTVSLSYVYSSKKTKSVVDSTKIIPSTPKKPLNNAPSAPPVPPALPNK
jgi:preprotein translocase subunit SecG